MTGWFDPDAIARALHARFAEIQAGAVTALADAVGAVDRGPREALRANAAEAQAAAAALAALPAAERRRRALLTVRCRSCRAQVVVVYRWGARRLVWFGFDRPDSGLRAGRAGGPHRPVLPAARRVPPEWWGLFAARKSLAVKCRCSRADRRVSVAALSDTLNAGRSATTVDVVLYSA